MGVTVEWLSVEFVVSRANLHTHTRKVHAVELQSRSTTALPLTYTLHAPPSTIISTPSTGAWCAPPHARPSTRRLRHAVTPRRSYVAPHRQTGSARVCHLDVVTPRRSTVYMPIAALLVGLSRSKSNQSKLGEEPTHQECGDLLLDVP